MNQEDRIIPFKVSELPSGKWLVFAPHPDDEVFGMGGALSIAAQHSVDITIVYVTSGGLGGSIAVREEEARAVCRALNARPIFMGLPDRGVFYSSDTVAHFTKILSQHPTHHVFFPSPLEYHPDHRSVAALVWKTLQSARNAERQVFSYEISRQSEANTLVDISAQASDKESLVSIYSSQTAQNNYLDVVLSLNKARTYTLPSSVKLAEAFYRHEHIWGQLKNAFSQIQATAFDNILPWDRPKISFIIRTQNRLELLERAIESVKAQGYSDYIELVIVNDGGESVEEVTDFYRSFFSDIRVVEIPACRGRSAAANAGLINATGQFINFLDDDDELLDGHVASFLNNWRRSTDYKVFYRGVEVVSASGDQVMIYNEPYRAEKLIHTNYIPIHAVTFSRYFVDIGCRFDESLEYMEDWDFWIQVSRLAPFKHINRVTARYNLVGSSSASPHMRGYLDNAGHMNRVRDKWLDKWSAVERNRMVAALLSDVREP